MRSRDIDRLHRRLGQPDRGGSSATRLVGRDREISALTSALDRALQSAGQFVVIEGGPGFGKSRLIREVMLRAAERGFAVLHAECDPDLGQAPFACLASALGAHRSSNDPARRRLATDLGGVHATADPEQRYRAADAAVAFVEDLTRRMPTLLVLDDFQHADSGTRLAVTNMVPLVDRRLMVILARRLHEPDDELVSAARIRLGSLSHPAVAALATQLLDARPHQSLLRHLEVFGGSPLLVTEFLRQLEWDADIVMSRGVAAVREGSPSPAADALLGRRIDSLPKGAVELLHLASVLGQAFSVRELAALSGRPASELIEPLAAATEAGVLVERGGTLAFSHVLLHDHVYGRLPDPLRRELHRDAARALERSGARPGRIARHLAEAADPGDPRAATWLAAAGREIMASAPVEAAALLTRALTMGPTGELRGGEVAADLAEAQMWCGSLTDAVATARRALAAGLDGRREAALRAQLTRSLRWQGRPAEAYEQARTAGSESRELQAEAALAAVFSQRIEVGRALAAEVIAKAGTDLAACIALSARCFGGFASCRWSEALEAGARAVSLGESEQSIMAVAQPRLYYGHILNITGRLAEAEQQLQTGLREAEAAGRRWQEPFYHQFLARKYWLSGEWDDALAESEAAAAAAEDITRGSATLMAGPAHTMSILMHRGLLVGPASLVATQGAEPLPDSPTGATLTDWQLALLFESQGQLDRALDVLLPLWRRTIAGGLLVELRQAGPDFLRIAIAAGRRGEVEFALTVMAEIRERARHPLAEAAWLHFRGLWEESFEVCREAVGLLETSARPLELATTCESAARLAKSAGRSDEAVTMALAAESVYERLGAVMDLGRIRSLLRGLGTRRIGHSRHRRESSGWESLTQTELRVAGLVAAGLSNPEVAERLFISRRTVETHLKHVYTKLELTSRVQLASAFARRRG